MNKKGFTLVELIVSITLISIVLVSMTATLISLRTAYSRAYEDSDVLVYSSSISRVLNNDFTNNNGIRSISCNLIGTRCDITFGNNERRQLKIVEVPDSSPQSVIDQRGYRKQRTTLQYIDKNTNEILYIKTLNLTEAVKNGGQSVSGYIFGNIHLTNRKYESASFADHFDVLTTLKIEIYDGEDYLNNSSYDINLYSSGTYSNDVLRSGAEYRIGFNKLGGQGGTNEMYLRYNKGYYDSSKKFNPDAEPKAISKITPPEDEPGVRTFEGYYRDVRKPFTQVINAEGNILAGVIEFEEDTMIYAKWKYENVTFKFNANGGTGTMSNFTTKYSNNENLPANTFTKTGYNFVGWKRKDPAYGQEETKVYVDKSKVLDVSPDGEGGTIELIAQWDGKESTVTYDATGGTVTPSTHIVKYDYKYGQNENGVARELPVPERTGYDFVGWFTASSGGTQITKNSTVNKTSNHTLYAQWTPRKYTVTLNNQSATVPGTASVEATFGSAMPAITKPEKTGNDFLGYYTSANAAGTQYYKNDGKSARSWGIASNTTLYAAWKLKDYTISFNSQGGSSVNPIIVQYGKYIPATATTSKTGYTFDGWYDAASGGTKLTGSNFTASANKTFYAHWTANKYTITYNANGIGSTPSPSTKQITFDSTYGELPSMSNTYYTFDGWYDAATGGTKITSSTKVTKSENHTLYAHWTAKSFTISFDANGGSTPNPTSKSVTYNTNYGTLATTSRTGYNLNGWYDAASGGNKIETTTKMTKGAHTLYAQWSPKPITVTYDANGGSVSPTTTTVLYGNYYGTLATPTRVGHAFAGWYTAASGGTQVTSQTQMTKTSNHTIYAHWNTNKYKVTYHANGGVGAPSATEYTYATSGTVNLSSTKPTRDGYEFKGWSTNSSAAVADYDAGAAWQKNTASNTTLYAVWKKIAAGPGGYLPGTITSTGSIWLWRASSDCLINCTASGNCPKCYTTSCHSLGSITSGSTIYLVGEATDYSSANTRWLYAYLVPTSNGGGALSGTSCADYSPSRSIAVEVDGVSKNLPASIDYDGTHYFLARLTTYCETSNCGWVSGVDCYDGHCNTGWVTTWRP